MMSIYPIVRIQFLFVQFSLLCYEFCILSKTECKSIYYHFRRDHECSSFRKLARNTWICRKACDFFRYTTIPHNHISLIPHNRISSYFGILVKNLHLSRRFFSIFILGIKGRGKRYFTKTTLINVVSYHIKKRSFTIGSTVFKQSFGIPMRIFLALF